MEKIKILSPAKINLNLVIEKKREDGFHNINSLIQPISLYDEILIEITDHKKKIDLIFPDKFIEFEDNLIVKASKSFLDYFKIKDHIRISVKKNIPLGSGMGGGSSNAASTLIALSKLFKIDDFPILRKIALDLGSDVLFFLYSRTSKVSGRGEIVDPFYMNEKMKYMLIFPGLHSNTKTLYDMWDNLDLRLKAYNRKEILNHIYNKIVIDKEDFILQNDFTPLLIYKNSKYLDVLNILKELNFTSYSITGSGSTIFCVLNDNVDYSESQKYLEANQDLITMNVESSEGWHFTFD